MKEALPEGAGPSLRPIPRVITRNRKLIALSIYALAAASAYTFAYLLRFDFRWPAQLTNTYLVTLPLLLVLRALSDSVFKLAVGSWRYVGVRDVVRLIGATALGTLLFLGALAVLPIEPAVPRSIIVVEWVLTTYITAGLWITYRLAFEVRQRNGDADEPQTRALIVGAGEAGSGLAREMLRRRTGYLPVAFVDDSPFLWGATIHGVEVVGSTTDLTAIAKRSAAEEIIIAIPSSEALNMRRIVESCEATELPTKILPGIAEVLNGTNGKNGKLDHVRELRIEDLLGRDPVTLELPELAADLEGQAVLVTGAAGSIGSELVRQVAMHEPSCVILYDQAETDLYYLELELRRKHPALKIVPVVADILDTAALDAVFDEYNPSRVYHAAAYKHVPLMECNPREAVRNNVIGTSRVAEAAGRAGTEKFVLISTDKAVRPRSVMGATKRLAELVMLDYQEKFASTWYVAVRFGNVLGSKGSVIPLFQKQLENGEPLTVTHEEVTRFFMTIPEATQLVLQASLIPEARGRVAMLEMGEPVKILDLAKKLIRLAGMREGVDADITITGLRPGEKMAEELTAPEEVTVPTSVEKIRLVETGVSEAKLAELGLFLDRVVGIKTDPRSKAMRRVLMDLIEGSEVGLPDDEVRVDHGATVVREGEIVGFVRGGT